MANFTFLLLQLLFCCLTKVNSFNFSYQTVFNFGDSNSDTGGLTAGMGVHLPPPIGYKFSSKLGRRFCDGRLITDFLMDAMDLPFMNPYLDSLGAPNFLTGCNFATGGSTMLPVKRNAISPFSFGVQVAQFIRFKARVLELLADGSCRNSSLVPTAEDFEQALYMFDIGQNDIDVGFYSESYDQVLSLITTMLSEFRSGIEKLYSQGARNFWVHNMGPIGCLPRIIATFGKNASRLDQLQCVDSHNQAAKIFNSQLHSLCAEFQQQFPEAKVTYVDIYTIKSNLIANYSQYGFKYALTACCGYGGLPLNIDLRIGCGETKILNGSVARAGPCPNATEYVNWDGNHYTEAANHYVSSQILSGKYLQFL